MREKTSGKTSNKKAGTSATGQKAVKAPKSDVSEQLKAQEDAELVCGVDLVAGEDETVLVFRAIRPLSRKEHQQVSDKLRYEAEKTGLKIVLMPYTCSLGDDAGA